MNALAACRLSIGMQEAGRVVTVDAKPIKRFEAWIQADGLQRSLWPGVIELSEDFFATLTEHAVPLDPRAASASRHSALALDVYTWLAHRLCRVRTPTGTRLSWENLRGQFGQEYRSSRDFKKEFRRAFRQVRLVLPRRAGDRGHRRAAAPAVASADGSHGRRDASASLTDTPAVDNRRQRTSCPPSLHHPHSVRCIAPTSGFGVRRT